MDAFEKFLSTPSARRATGKRGLHQRHHPISIHALCEEGDPVFAKELCTTQAISIHALCEEGDRAERGEGLYIEDFYPRPLRGGRHDSFTPELVYETISIHALCEEGDVASSSSTSVSKSFLSTPSARRATVEVHEIN